MMRTPPLLAVAALGALFCGCSPKYGMRVPDELVTKLPYETRIELLEAENELAVAIDKRDEAHNEIARARDALRRAKDRLSAADDEVDEAEDAVSREVAELALQEASARVEWLRARQAVNVARLEIEELALRCAFARYELARLEAARKAKVEGSESLSVEEFGGQVKACDEEVKTRRAELKGAAEAEAELAKASWEKHKTALAKKTFDARASPYVE